MRIYHLIWDEWNEEHIAHHGVTAEEAEDVAYGHSFMTRAREGLYRLIGQRNAGRLLTVYVEPRGGGTFYVVTARDATLKERRVFQPRRRR
ncbi:MAG: BrnT family toxin [Chloroflexia bacterium]|nr:BrnT family toxin [Chloroflexia bacterium]